MIHALFDSHINEAQIGGGVSARSRLAGLFRAIRRVLRNLVDYRVAPLEPTPMVMTAAFGGRTYTRPGGGPRTGSW